MKWHWEVWHHSFWLQCGRRLSCDTRAALLLRDHLGFDEKIRSRSRRFIRGRDVEWQQQQPIGAAEANARPPVDRSGPIGAGGGRGQPWEPGVGDLEPCVRNSAESLENFLISALMLINSFSSCGEVVRKSSDDTEMFLLEVYFVWNIATF